MQHFAPHMPPGPSIVNILSIAAKTGFANWSAYCMSKFALEGCSQCVREELRDRRIRMINVYPAATDTHIWTHIEGKWPRHKMISRKESPAPSRTRCLVQRTSRWRISLFPAWLEISDAVSLRAIRTL